MKKKTGSAQQPPEIPGYHFPFNFISTSLYFDKLFEQFQYISSIVYVLKLVFYNQFNNYISLVLFTMILII